jgi:transketolase
MRTAFIDALLAQARERENVFLVVGDLGFSVVEPFAREFPRRFLNAGVAEQNMTGLAAGLASEGFHVFTYSIANFPTLRCYEQFRNDVCYHRLPVTVVAVGAGLAYGNLGYSHHGVQDLACFRALPHCTVLSPADPGEARRCLQHLLDNPGASYLRLGKAGEQELHPEVPVTREPLRVAGTEGSTRAVVATGSVLGDALAAARAFENQTGESVAVYSMPWIAPAAGGQLAALWGHRRVITVEEHVRPGGLGEWVASVRPDGVAVHSLHLDLTLIDQVGSQSWLRARHGIDCAGIAAALKQPVAEVHAR